MSERRVSLADEAIGRVLGERDCLRRENERLGTALNLYGDVLESTANSRWHQSPEAGWTYCIQLAQRTLNPDAPPNESAVENDSPEPPTTPA